MPKFNNIEAFEGEDVVIPFIIKNQTETTVENITGWTLVLTLKSNFSQSAIVLSKTAVITDGAAGTCTVTFNRADTVSLTPKTYCYDLSRTDSGSDSCLVYGYFHLKDRAR